MLKKFAVLVAAGLLAACSNTSAPASKDAKPQTAANPQPLPPFVFVKDIEGAPRVGKGTLGYRFVLLEPNTNRLAANTPFAISHTQVKLPFAGADNVYRGMTDARGMTPLFVVEQALPEAGWILVPRAGEGTQGQWLTLANPQQQPMAGWLYSIAVCGAKPYWVHGQTNVLGQTAYVAHAESTKLVLYPYSADAAVQQTRLKACPAPQTATKAKSVKPKAAAKKR